MNITYVLPLRWSDDADLTDLSTYLGWLSARAEVIVVDGSDPALFERHRDAWAGLRVQHIPPDPEFVCTMGKVAGVHTGLRRASQERVVIADDDVRFDEIGLTAIAELLDRYDLVRPQNYFDALPWHARWDTARTLLARAVGRDWPGTLGIRRSTFWRMGGYDGDAMFENLECLRTVRGAGGRIVSPLGLYVARRPPTTSLFLHQRIRQAYDELARPALLALWLSLIPGTTYIVLKTGWKGAAALIGSAVALAEVGRRRAGGTRVFPASTSLFAPLWLSERAVTAWIAVWFRMRRGGIPYRDSVVPHAATSQRELRRRQQRAGAARSEMSHSRR